MGNPNKEAAFFYNFLDGHIKKVTTNRGTLFYRCGLGNEWGANDFEDNGDGTVTGHNSGLIWQQQEDTKGQDWEAALSYCEALDLSGESDWRLPNVKV